MHSSRARGAAVAGVDDLLANFCLNFNLQRSLNARKSVTLPTPDPVFSLSNAESCADLLGRSSDLLNT